MFRNKLLSIVTLIVFFISAFVAPAFAVTDPNFPSCLNPQGQLKVAYTQGTHGVPGDTNTYNGSDSVYTIDEATTTQCLCTVNGSGIQTNWWKVSSMSEEQVSVLVNQGWIFIPDGSAWGLENAPYLAKNLNFACGSTTTTTTDNGDGLGCAVHDCSSHPQVLAAKTQAVLGLASTGNITFLLSVVSLGIAFITGGLILSSRKSK